MTMSKNKNPIRELLVSFNKVHSPDPKIKEMLPKALKVLPTS